MDDPNEDESRKRFDAAHYIKFKEDEPHDPAKHGWKPSDFLKLIFGIGVIIAAIALLEALGRANGG